MLDPNAVGLGLFFGITLIVAVVASRMLNGKIPSADLRGSEIVFRTPRVPLVTMVVTLMLLPASGAYVLPGQIASILAEHDSLAVTLGWLAAITMFFVGLPLLFVAVLLGGLPGPQELRLDKNQRTYRLRSGTFLKRQFRSGSWEDIKGIYVKEISVKGSSSYGVYVAWRQGLSGGPFLALTGERDQAERQAEKIAQEIGWQVVGPPTV